MTKYRVRLIDDDGEPEKLWIASDGEPTDRAEEAHEFTSATEAAIVAASVPWRARWETIKGQR